MMKTQLRKKESKKKEKPDKDLKRISLPCENVKEKL